MAIQIQKFDDQTIITSTDEMLAETTANIIVKAFSRLLTYKERITFIPSSGKTPLKTYQYLVKHHSNTIDWSRVTVVQMDEYCGSNLKPKFYFYHFLKYNLVRPLGIKTFISMRQSEGIELYTPEEYKQKLEILGQIDFALHGIGRNGHIGFNEPGSSRDSETRLIALKPMTQNDNFPNLSNLTRPQYGMTLGLKELQCVAHTILIATGQHKAAAIRNLMSRNSVSHTPASVLWDSPDFGVIIDTKAARLLY